MITRFEIIDWRKDTTEGGGRKVMVSPNDKTKVWFDLQDDGRTLKVFLEEEQDQ